MKTSVLITTYNHEQYIAYALDSALNQRTSFDYEVVVADDCSTDGTREVIREFDKRHAGRLRPLLRDKNLGMPQNAVATFEACRGEYIAALDGDDYWISPYKLQRQVDFLDRHPECAFCFHNVLILFRDGSDRPDAFYCRHDQKDFCDLEDLLQENMVPGCSLMFRRSLAEVPDWVNGLACPDWALCLLLAEHGKGGYLADTMSVMRKLRGGAWTGIGAARRVQSLTTMYERINERLGFKYNELIRAVIPKWKAIQRLEAIYLLWQETIRTAEERWRRFQAKHHAAPAEAVSGQVESGRGAPLDGLAASLAEAAGSKDGAALQAAERRRVFEPQELQLAGLAEGLRALVGRGDEIRDLLLAVVPAADRALDEIERGLFLWRLRDTARVALPAGARVLVVSKGDNELLALGAGCQGEHFPQGEGGSYLGHHPAESEEAIANLEALRAQGAEYLLFPNPSRWWLDHYEALRHHLDDRYPRAWEDGDCVIYCLASPGPAAPRRRSS